MCNALIVVWGGRRKPSLVSCNGNRFLPGKYIVTSWQNRMRACMGDTFTGGKRNQATEKRTEMIAMWPQPLRQPSPLRSTNAHKKTPSSSEGERTQKQHTKMICDNQNERGFVQLTADRRTKPVQQLVVAIPLNLFPT